MTYTQTMRAVPQVAGACRRHHASFAACALQSRPLVAEARWSRQTGHLASASVLEGPCAATASDTDTASLRPDTDVADAIRAACERLRKPYPSEAVQALHDNWFSTAAELASMPDEAARSLGVPLRLKSAVADMLAASGSIADMDGAAARAAEVPTQQQRRPRRRSKAGDGGGGSSSSSGSDLLGSAAQLPAQAALSIGNYLAAAEEPADWQQTASSSGNSAGSSLAVAAAAVLSGSSSGGSSAYADQLDLPIEQRRCPPLGRFNNAHSNLQKVSKRSRTVRYALSESEISETLRQEFTAFHRFLTVRFFGAQSEAIAEGTAAKYADHVRGMLGYAHRELGVPLDALSFSSILPSSGREGVTTVFDYILWLHDTRQISIHTEGLVVRSAGAAAKFLYHGDSKVNPSRGEQAYSDLDVVKELRTMSNSAKKSAKVAPRASDEELKWIDWPEYLRLCGELRLECASLDACGRRRPDSVVAWSLQRYLIFAILSCVPDRQRTLRELELGRTLVKDKDGRWVIRHGPGDYKTGRAYGERPPLIIAPHIYPELEAFMGKWRSCLQPQHGNLFTQQNGEPLTEKSLYKLFWTSAYRITGKKCNPHLIRDSVVTYLRGSGASERELEALALYMGHSVTMQRDTYDRRTKGQKVEPAVELLESLNRKALEAGGSSGGSDSSR